MPTHNDIKSGYMEKVRKINADSQQEFDTIYNNHHNLQKLAEEKFLLEIALAKKKYQGDLDAIPYHQFGILQAAEKRLSLDKEINASFTKAKDAFERDLCEAECEKERDEDYAHAERNAALDKAKTERDAEILSKK